MIDVIVMLALATIIGAIATVIGTCIAWRKRKGGSDDLESGRHIKIKGKGNVVQQGKINIKNNKGKVNIQR